MPRKREIKPSFYMDEDLAECSVWARLLFPALWQLADREGRLEDRPAMIRIHAFPYDNLEGLSLSVHEMLNELARPRKHCPDGDAFILRYVVGGRAYIQIKNFKEHQRCHPNEVGSEIPPYEKVTARTTKVDSAVHQGDTRSRLQSKPSKPSSSLVTDPAADAAPFASVESETPLPETTAPGGNVVPLKAPSPWNREAAELWWLEYKGAPPKQFFQALKPLVRRETWERVRPALVTYMAETPAEYVNISGKFVAAFGTWESRARGQPSKRGGSVAEKNASVLDEWAQEVREGKR